MPQDEESAYFAAGGGNDRAAADAANGGINYVGLLTAAINAGGRLLQPGNTPAPTPAGSPKPVAQNQSALAKYLTPMNIGIALAIGAAIWFFTRRKGKG